jgi:polyferredoxin
MARDVEKVLGDTLARTLLKLVVISLIVGFVMATFGIDPWGLIYTIRNFISDIWYNGFAALGAIGDYLILGGAIVLPVFIVIRLLSYRR